MACMTGLDFDGDSDRDADPGLLPLQDQRRRKEVWDGGKPTGVWERSPPAGSRSGAPVGGLGDEVPRS